MRPIGPDADIRLIGQCPAGFCSHPAPLPVKCAKLNDTFKGKSERIPVRRWGAHLFLLRGSSQQGGNGPVVVVQGRFQWQYPLCSLRGQAERHHAIRSGANHRLLCRVAGDPGATSLSKAAVAKAGEAGRSREVKPRHSLPRWRGFLFRISGTRKQTHPRQRALLTVSLLL